MTGGNLAYRSGSGIQVYKDGDGWGFCVVGVSKDGHYYESDDYSGFDSRSEAIAAAYDFLAEL